MDGLPVVIRLIDPPLHEFLPNLEEQLVKVTRAEATGGRRSERRGRASCCAPIEALHEQNPMLGLRGCRLGPDDPRLRQDPDARDPQRRDRRQAGRRRPARQDHDPARRPRERAGRARRRSSRPRRRPSRRPPGVEVDYKFGTMIEVPRGALTADEIAHDADVLQLRHQRPDPDDVRLQPRRRRGRVPAEVRRGRDPAGQPVPDARRRGRRPADADRPSRRAAPRVRTSSSASAASTAAIPASIAFCDEIGLDYVSCSPFRVPVARLAAAQAALTGPERDK